jgi:hypothetical protein
MSKPSRAWAARLLSCIPNTEVAAGPRLVRLARSARAPGPHGQWVVLSLLRLSGHLPLCRPWVFDAFTFQGESLSADAAAVEAYETPMKEADQNEPKGPNDAAQ